jgi:imidazole glycerol phosphate synthase glutamine amidotransferase subunit
MKVALIDYGAGNLPSVERALLRLGAQTERADSPDALAAASVVILPGVGHYGAMIRALDKNGLREALLASIHRGVPFLGICLGLQVLYETSEEAPELRGLEIFSSTVRKLPSAVKLPHMGWNQVQHANGGSRLLGGIGEDAYFYFAHSFAATRQDSNQQDRDASTEIRATCTYGEEFVAVAETKNVFAVQFHPEKSGEAGQRVLGNFLRLAA